VKAIAPSEMDKLLATEPDMVMIHVRTPAEFSAERATRAKNVPLDSDTSHQLARGCFLESRVF
jgi:rhodanese-related sulfurtransferase